MGGDIPTDWAAKFTSTIEKLGIDDRGKKASASGKYKWGNNNRKFVAAFEKDQADWKIRAFDYGGEQGLIKEIDGP